MHSLSQFPISTMSNLKYNWVYKNHILLFQQLLVASFEFQFIVTYSSLNSKSYQEFWYYWSIYKLIKYNCILHNKKWHVWCFELWKWVTNISTLNLFPRKLTDLSGLECSWIPPNRWRSSWIIAYSLILPSLRNWRKKKK